ncbi:MAG: hypothetical protein M3203_00705 [Actinomycetota bacterium]|nr:hypothetical protein [Actinomycetota bacterium]
MIHKGDPLERLRSVNPVPRATVERLGPDPVLFRAIVAEEAVGPRPARRRIRILVPALAATSVLGGAVAYGMLRDQHSKPQSAACYEQADVEARTEVVGVGPEGPVAACAELWRGGVFGWPGEPPPLAECVLATGVVGVFPTTGTQDVCRQIGVEAEVTTTAPPPTLADVNERFRAFREAVLPRFVDSPCMEPGPAAEVVRRELDRAGLGEWRVRTGDFSPDRPCATLWFRPEVGEVVLVPAPSRR